MRMSVFTHTMSSFEDDIVCKDWVSHVRMGKEDLFPQLLRIEFAYNLNVDPSGNSTTHWASGCQPEPWLVDSSVIHANVAIWAI